MCVSIQLLAAIQINQLIDEFNRKNATCMKYTVHVFIFFRQ